MKQPMISRDVLPKNVPGVGWGGVGCVMQGWGGVYHTGVGWVIQGWGISCRSGVGCIIQGWGGVYHAGVGWGGSYRGGMIHTEHCHHLHTVPCGNYLELLREHKFNYNHKLRLGCFLLSTKRET